MGFLSKTFSKINTEILKYFLMVATLMTILMTFVILLQVVCRYFFNSALPWPEELARYAMVWLTFMVAPGAYQKGLKINVTLLSDRVSEGVKLGLNVFCHGVVLALSLLLLYQTLMMTQRGLGISASSMSFNLAYIYVSMPLSFLLISSVAIEKILSCFTKSSSH
jgi:TRAP-type transport system small permease protein